MKAKKLMIGLLAGAMILGTAVTANAADTNFSFNFTSSEKTTETSTVEDSQGRSYEVTHTVETIDGETTEFYENVPIEFINQTGVGITGLYITNTSEDTWGDNLLVTLGGGMTIEDGADAAGLHLDYSPEDTHLDVKIECADGAYHEFRELGFDNLNDNKHINMFFTVSEEGDYQVTTE